MSFMLSRWTEFALHWKHFELVYIIDVLHAELKTFPSIHINVCPSYRFQKIASIYMNNVLHAGLKLAFVLHEWCPSRCIKKTCSDSCKWCPSRFLIYLAIPLQVWMPLPDHDLRIVQVPIQENRLEHRLQSKW